MGSDLLHEAAAEIGRYQRSFPKSYDGLRVEIGKVTAVMNALKTSLDCPPSRFCVRWTTSRRLGPPRR
jgi:hypothetical protein